MKIGEHIRRVDYLGRIQIPKDIRESLKIKEGCSMEIVAIDGLIIIGKVKESETE